MSSKQILTKPPPMIPVTAIKKVAPQISQTLSVQKVPVVPVSVPLKSIPKKFQKKGKPVDPEEEEEEKEEEEEFPDFVSVSGKLKLNKNEDEQVVDPSKIDEEFEEYSSVEITNDEALKLSQDYNVEHIKFSTCYNMDARNETLDVMFSIMTYCEGQPKAAEILSKMVGYAKVLNKDKLSRVALKKLINTKVEVRKQACGLKPGANVIRLHEYNILQALFDRNHREITVTKVLITILVNETEYSMEKNENGFWCMDEEEGVELARVCGENCRWVSLGLETHLVFMFSQIANVKVVDGMFQMTKAPIDTMTIFKTLTNTEQLESMSVRTYIFDNVSKVLANAKNVPSVTPDNDILSIMISHFPAKGGLVKQVIRAMAVMEAYTPRGIKVVRDAVSLLSLKLKGIKANENDILKKGAKSEVAMTLLEESRVLRGGDKSVHNTYLKDVVDLGPPIPALSTYVKWKKTCSHFNFEDVTLAMIGCTSKQDWWSGCSGVNEKNIKRYDINPVEGVDPIDIFSDTIKVKSHVIMSDVFVPLPKPTGEKTKTKVKGPTVSELNMNQQSKVPEKIFALANRSGSSTVFVKCFPINIDGKMSISHLGLRDDEKKGWYFNLFFYGRCHNMEFILLLTREIDRTDQMIACADFNEQMENKLLSYILGLSVYANKMRNQYLTSLSFEWNVRPTCSLKGLPLGKRGVDSGAELLDEMLDMCDEYKPCISEKRYIRQKEAFEDEDQEESVSLSNETKLKG